MSRTRPKRRGRDLAVVRTIAELRAAVRTWRRAGRAVGLVPTMGALHEGHLALLRAAQDECDRVCATIFVNPAQFNRREDLDNYPRDEAEDIALLKAVGTDLLYAPSAAEMYPAGFSTSVAVAGLTDGLCGANRPGHFAGVATVVTKLLLQALPDAAYFGEKDYQQLRVVQRLARDLDIPVRIAAVATVREADGLALSSRNRRLTPQQRLRAPALYRVLSALAERLADGQAPADPVLAWGRDELLRGGFDEIDYLELRSADLLEPVARADRPARLLGAAWLGPVRLIDNLSVGAGGSVNPGGCE